MLSYTDTQAQFASAGYNQLFYSEVQTLAYDEATHVSFLTSALTAAGASPVAACTYNFGEYFAGLRRASFH